MNARGIVDLRPIQPKTSISAGPNLNRPFGWREPIADSTSRDIGCQATIDLDGAAATDWDITVIGAGPAGAFAARQLALSGLRTLLLDKCPFPRSKVCGGCLSGLGTQILRDAGLGHLVEEPAAARLDRFHLAAGGRSVSLPLPLGTAVSRREFDAALVREAIVAGADFLPETTVAVRGLTAGCRFRRVELQGACRRTVRTRSRLVVVADGLGRTSIKHHPHFAPRIAAASRVGLGATLSGGEFDLEPGTVAMSVDREGYVGMVRLPNGAVNVAAAVDPRVLRQLGAGRTVHGILAQSGVLIQSGVRAPSCLSQADWRGTGLLTRHGRRVAAKRLILLGDAAGYIEPFTGEGMTWALLAANSLAPLAGDWLRSGDRGNDCQLNERDRELSRLSTAWTKRYQSQIAGRQRSCRWLAQGLRHPWAVAAALRLMASSPGISRPLVRYFWSRSNAADELRASIGSEST